MFLSNINVYLSLSLSLSLKELKQTNKNTKKHTLGCGLKKNGKVRKVYCAKSQYTKDLGITIVEIHYPLTDLKA